MLKTLLTVGLPRDDAHRLAKLFRQSGIRDEAYLRVFARMSTRDGWLIELCAKGVLTEIQMRVVKEALDQVASRRTSCG